MSAPEDGANRVVTLTFSPALDVATSVDVVTPSRKLRCDTPRQEPGGGGINVARVVQRLGADAVAVAPSGGDGTTDSFQRGTMVAPDGFRLATGSTGREILLGGISPLENDTPWQLDLAYDVTVESDGADRYVAVSFTPTDRPFLENNNRPSISVILRQNGVLAIFYRVGDGSGAVNAANKFVGTVATGHSVELRVVHQTDGTMAVSRLDDDATDSSPLTMSAAAGTDVAATDLYVHLGKTDNGSLSHDVLFHSPVITRP